MARVDSPSNQPTDLPIERANSAFDVVPPVVPGFPAVIAPGRRPRLLRTPHFLKLLLGNRKAAFGLAVLTVIVLMAVFAPILTPYHPADFADMPSESPSPTHWFGTTHQGQDVFAQVLYGGRISLFVAAAAAALATLISAFLGMLSAYVGGWLDETVNLVTNIFLVIPALPLLIVVSSYIPNRGTVSMILILAFFMWSGEERILRAQALTLRNRDFVMASAATGESVWRIVLGEIMPNMTSRIAAGFVGSFVGAILFAAALEFLGFGSLSDVSWGTTLFWAQNNASLMSGEWWHFTFPGLAIAISATSLIFINYAIDEISNPRLQKVKMPKAKKTAREVSARALTQR